MSYKPKVLEIAEGGTGSSSGSSLKIVTATGQLTNSQIKALHGTPIQILAAQGTGTIIRVVSAMTSFAYGGTNVFVAGASQTINLYYGTTTSIISLVSNSVIVGTASSITNTQNILLNSVTKSSVDNLALTWYNPIATEITGNAANDNVVNWSVSYIVSTL